MYDVVIVGAGPAGLFAAYELVSNSSLKVLIVDKGKDIANRQCPSLKEFQRCSKCDPCNILCGLGGAGGLSDGKLNLKSDVGGNLEEFVSKEEADGLVSKIDSIFLEHGASQKLYGTNSHELESKAAAAGLEFIPIPQRHIGSDRLPSVVNSIKSYLESKGASIWLNTEVVDITYDGVFKLKCANEQMLESRFVIVATGRYGADWITSQAKKLQINTRFAPIDIGVRVEVPAVVMEDIIEYAWDPKFHIYTPTYDDFVRTFCTCPNGFVVMEDYGDFIGVAKLATTIGGKMPIIQRLEDLKNGRRSTTSRIEKSFVKPTLKNATPGDISMALPHRIVENILEGLEKLDKVINGVNSDSTLLYAPEIKFYSMRFLVNNDLETNMPNFFVAGDGAGLSRGIVASAATGIIAARGIMKKA